MDKLTTKDMVNQLLDYGIDRHMLALYLRNSYQYICAKIAGRHEFTKSDELLIKHLYQSMLHKIDLGIPKLTREKKDAIILSWLTE